MRNLFLDNAWYILLVIKAWGEVVEERMRVIHFGLLVKPCIVVNIVAIKKAAHVGRVRGLNLNH